MAVTIATSADIGGALGTDEVRVHHLTGKFKGMTLVNKMSDSSVTDAVANHEVLAEGGAVLAPPLPTPTLAAFNPNTLTQDAIGVVVSVPGTGFVPGVSTLTIAAPAVITSYSFSTAVLGTMTVNVGAAPLGNLRVTVSNGPGKSANRNINVIAPVNESDDEEPPAATATVEAKPAPAATPAPRTVQRNR
jgi:hypothetical protein